MKIRFHSPDPEARRLRRRAVQRVRGVLARLGRRVERVSVVLDDANGDAPGDVDKRCRVLAELPEGGVARIDATSRHWTQSLEVAVAALRRRVLRLLRRALAGGGPGASIAPPPALAFVPAPVRRRTPAVHRLPARLVR